MVGGVRFAITNSRTARLSDWEDRGDLWTQGYFSGKTTPTTKGKLEEKQYETR
jgi:hypothetical protein